MSRFTIVVGGGQRVPSVIFWSEIELCIVVSRLSKLRLWIERYHGKQTDPVILEHHRHPVHLVAHAGFRVAENIEVELDHALGQLGGFGILLILVRDTFCDASDDGDGGDDTAKEEAEHHLYGSRCIDRS